MNYKNFLTLSLAFSFLILQTFNCPAQDIKLKINLRGAYESKMTLMPLIGPNAMKPVAERDGIKDGETAVLSVSRDKLPGEFVLRFDYKEKESSTPYPSEKHLIISNQNLELWVNPPYCNNNDSTWFQKNEKENTVYAQFFKENGPKKANLGMLRNLLMTYDRTDSKFYQLGIDEFESRRKEYNQWLAEQSSLYGSLFVSHAFQFQYMPQAEFKGSESDKMNNVLAHYFEGIDFNDSLLINTTNLRDWITGYVNIYGAMSVTEKLRDSLFTLAGKNAIEKARTGNPKVYGWMVDYFYNGYESNGITKAMAMLQQYIDDPNCLTSKKRQINKRLEGMAKLVVGSKSPDFALDDIDGINFDLHLYKGPAKYKLLLFWSAGCEHCQELVKQVKQWQEKTGNKEKADIIAVSLDETTEEVKKWEETIIRLPGWIHLRAKGGVNSTVANDYAILSTPAMFLVDSKSNVIHSIPDTLEELVKSMGN